MILTMLLLFFMLLIITAAIFYLFCFFLPALRLKYGGISDSLASAMTFSGDPDDEAVRADLSRVAVVGGAGKDKSRRRLVYKGERSCRLLHATYSTEYENPDTCIGFGDCARVCPQKAIAVRNGTAFVGGLCSGCGKCAAVCPAGIISLVPREKKAEENSGKGFKFWSACYKLLHGGMKVY